MPIIMQDIDKTPKEFLLLGNKTITKKDCQGNDVEVHGLTLNDLVYVKTDGTTSTFSIMLDEVVDNPGGITVTTEGGDQITLQEIANDLEDLSHAIYTVAGSEQQYNNIN